MTNARRKHVMLVDDSPDEEAFVRHALETAHPAAELTVCHDGRDALAHVRARAAEAGTEALPHVILLDLKMPAVDGQTTLRAMRQSFAPGVLPIVVFTSSREPTDVMRAYEGGANSFLVKPLVFEEYVKLVTATVHYWLDLNVRQPMAR